MLSIRVIKISMLAAIALWFSGESTSQLSRRVGFQKAELLTLNFGIKPVQARTNLAALDSSELYNPLAKLPTSKLIIYKDEEHHIKGSVSVIDISPISVNAYTKRQLLSDNCRNEKTFIRELRSVWSRDFLQMYDLAYTPSLCLTLTAPVGNIKIVVDEKPYELTPITVQVHDKTTVFPHMYTVPMNLREALEKLPSERVKIQLFSSVERSGVSKPEQPAVIVTLNPATVRLFKEIYRGNK